MKKLVIKEMKDSSFRPRNFAHETKKKIHYNRAYRINIIIDESSVIST